MTSTDREGPLALAVDRILPAAPEVVFRALTESGLFARWMGPEGSNVAVEEMDAVPGGRFVFAVSLPGGGVTVRLLGVYREVEPPERLVHTWRMEGEDAETTVTFRLRPHPEGTYLVLTHDGFADAADAGRNDAGWRHQLDRLAGLLAAGI